jgi:hypothetical protein
LRQDFFFVKIKAIDESQVNEKQIFLKFEPFILHVCCRTLTNAKSMLQAVKNYNSTLSQNETFLSHFYNS